MPREISNPEPRESDVRVAKVCEAFPAEPQQEDGASNLERAVSRRLSLPRPGPETSDSHRACYCADRVYLLRESELQTLAEIGTFRAIAARDLGRLGYGGDCKRMERDLSHLRDSGLVSERVVLVDRTSTLRLLALTRDGARLARRSAVVSEEQTLFHGFIRLHEAKHDSSLYRVYHAQARRIESLGGCVTRVVLDLELQGNLNRELAALDPWAEERERIALRHGLAMVDERIPIPDMRIEYDTVEMEHGYLDVEMATRNYRPRELSEKARAGFSLYALPEDAAHLRRVLDEQKIAARIVSL